VVRLAIFKEIVIVLGIIVIEIVTILIITGIIVGPTNINLGNTFLILDQLHLNGNRVDRLSLIEIIVTMEIV